MKNKADDFLETLVIRSNNTVTIQVSANSSRGMVENLMYYLHKSNPFPKDHSCKKLTKLSEFSYSGILTIVFKNNKVAACFLQAI